MHYLELIADRPLVWGLFAAYMAVTCYLAWLGHRRTGDMTSFAIGKGDMHPVVVGVTLAASIASTATFVINPGFVYVHGISALMHLGVAAGLGIIVGLFTLSFGFRRVGAKSKAITLPGWIAERYRSRGLAIFFALVSLLSLSFVVLILGGLSIVMQQTLGLSNIESLVLTVVFVFGYVFVGGTYAHAYTNTLQGILMVVIALLIVASGLPLLGGPGLAELAAAKPEWMAAVNPSSPLFSSFFSVFVAGFLVGFALVCQPHILTKALYVKSDRAVRQYLTVTVLVSIAFTALLLVGVYAHLAEIPAAAFVDPATGAFRQDQVMAVYLAKTFDPTALAVITVALLAAGMSTLDGILVALSSIAASDLFLRIAGRRLEHVTAERRSRLAHRVSQLVLVAMGLVAFLVALDPPKLLGIFGQVGVYGIVAASAVPLLFGIAFPRFGRNAATAAAVTGLLLHFGLYLAGSLAHARGIDLRVLLGATPLSPLLDASAYQLGWLNPGVTATYGLLGSALVALPFTLRRRTVAPQAAGAAL